MDSVNTFPAVQGSAPNPAFNYSSVGDESGDQADLFAAILSQAQSVPPQPPPDPANIQNQPPSVQQSPQNNAANANAANVSGTDNAGGANGTSASSNAGATNNASDTNGGNGGNTSNDSGTGSPNGGDPPNSDANASPQAMRHGTKSGRPSVGKLSRRLSKTGSSKTDTNTAANTAAGNTPGPSPVAPAAIANQAAANGIAITGQGNANIDPASVATAVSPADPVSGSNAMAGAPANANKPSSNAGPAANNDLASNTDAALNAGLILNADPKTGATSAAGNGNNAADPAAPAGGQDVAMSSHLMLLLMQLEHLAAGQAAAPTASVGPAIGGGQTTGAAQQAAAPGGDQGKIDLKALMSAIAKLDGGGANGENIDPQDAGNAANASPNSASSSSSATSPNAAPAWGNAPSNAESKWISPDFLNLFSLPANNPAGNAGVSTPSPALFASGIVAGTPTGGDGAALDDDTQGQTNAGARDNALLSGNNSLPPAMGSAQAANPYDFASQLSALRATQGGSTGLPAPIDQVILQLSRTLTKDGSSQMSIQLRPAELGRVDVKLTIGSDGKVQGTVTADNPSTLNLLLKDVRGLERALQEAGLRADSGSLQFGLRGDGQAGGGSGQPAGNSTAFDDDSVSSSGATAILPGFAGPAETYYLTPGGVNMRV